MNNVHTFQAHSEPVRSCRWDSVVCTSTSSSMLPFNLPSARSCCSVLMVFAAVVETHEGFKNHQIL